MRVSLSVAQRQIAALEELSKAKLPDEQNRVLLVFVLTYSAFESLFGGSADFISEKPYIGLDLNWSKRHFDFFVKRYVTNESINSKFNRHFRNSHDEQWVKKRLLCSGALPADEMFLTVFKIAYRFRNNLLHGNEDKAIDQLPQYIDCFKNITEFMQCLMKRLVSKEAKNG